MDRQIPDVWRIFSLSGPEYNHHQNRAPIYPNMHVNWSHANTELLNRWTDRSSPCERPRTYDKFYQKVPGNFKDFSGKQSAKSVCSSDDEGSSNYGPEPEVTNNVKQKSRRKKRDRKYSRTITEREVRHLERHLSMKKTIRKKIMRDLQQAFVGGDQQNQAQKLPENVQSLNFDPKKAAGNNDEKLLDLLKRESEDSGVGQLSSDNHSDHSDSNQQTTNAGQHLLRMQKNQQRIVSDSSSCGGYESTESRSDKDIVVLAAERISAIDLVAEQQQQRRGDRHAHRHAANAWPAYPAQHQHQQNVSKNVSKQDECVKPKKTSFWHNLFGKKKDSKKSAS